jgi:hypothetical protein
MGVRGRTGIRKTNYAGQKDKSPNFPPEGTSLANVALKKVFSGKTVRDGKFTR